MPYISVSMFPGRTHEQKAALAERVTDAFIETCGGRKEGITVVINEVPGEHWAVGGKLITPPAE